MRNDFRKSRRGVALIFFMLVFGLILGFFMLIANTGLIVYQKMRLQTATDMAAYAGAAVQATYLNNSQSEDSIYRINQMIQLRYSQLLNDLKFGSKAAWPVAIPNVGACVAACQAANLVNAEFTKRTYERAAADIQKYHQKIDHILKQLPRATREAVEATMRMNIPDLKVESDPLASATGDVTDNPEEMAGDFSFGQKKKHAVLTFASKKGMYLANIVAPVPHSFAYFGPACFNQNQGLDAVPLYYCTVNGAGVGGGPSGLASASQAFALAFTPQNANTGFIKKIADQSAKAIRLQFVQNAHRPDPFVVVAAEWRPQGGSFMNMENSLGAKGSLFPKDTRLVAVAAAEPFGGDLISSNANTFGVRLQSIRKLLLDPRVKPLREDYPSLFKYMGSLGPKDDTGRNTESVEDTVRRFLH